jgi:hypothetical protein
MRTKVLLCAAALAASLASSMAQNVYSLNVVGYVNQTVQAGHWYMWGNPLSANGGNFTTNVIPATALSGDGSAWANALVYAYTASGGFGNADTFYAQSGFTNWFPGTLDLSPGNGFFFYAPTSGTVTFVGQVVTTNKFSLPGPNTWSMVGSAYPVSTNLVELGIVGGANDQVYRYGSVNNPAGYDNGATYYNVPGTFVGWFDSYGTSSNGPTLNVGEAVFYKNANATVNWTKVFTIP